MKQYPSIFMAKESTTTLPLPLHRPHTCHGRCSKKTTKKNRHITGHGGDLILVHHFHWVRYRGWAMVHAPLYSGRVFPGPASSKTVYAVFYMEQSVPVMLILEPLFCLTNQYTRRRCTCQGSYQLPKAYCTQLPLPPTHGHAFGSILVATSISPFLDLQA